MSSVDSRIVTMKFDNADFGRKVSQTMSMMDKLKSKLNFTDGAKGLTAIGNVLGKFGLKNPFANAQKGAAELQKATNRFNMNGIEGGITNVSRSFLAMSTVAITALSNITNRAFDAGLSMSKALTFDPVTAGMSEYETNLKSIQTILANTKAAGTNLKDVNGALSELNEYSDKTIYNFSEMAKNIGTFTAAGVDLDTSVASIKGIANLAALSGSNSEKAAGAMYQLSQAIASGRVSLMDWNSVLNAGMAGTTFQRALAQTAVAMGELDEKSVKLSGAMKNVKINGESFRDSISASSGQASWLTKDVLTNTLKQFTGDLKLAEIQAMGFSKAQAQSIQATARTAMLAATEVKTLSAVFEVAKETAGSGWSRTWQLIFGDFKEAKTLFTSVSTTFSGMIAKGAEARNKLLEDWKGMGGRDTLIDAFGNAFEALMSVLKPIREAFRDIFPPMTAQRLYDLTVRLKEFTEGLKISETTSANLKRTFAGVFAVFSIVGSVIKGLFGVFTDLVGVLGVGDGSILNFTGGLGDFLVAVDNAIKKGGLLNGFFEGLGKVLAVPVRMLSNLIGFISGLFNGFDTGAADGVANAMGNIEDRMKPLTRLGNMLSSIWENISAAFEHVKSALEPLIAGIADAFGAIGEAIANSFSGDSFDRVLDVINTGLLGGIVIMLKNFTSGGLVKIDMGEGLFGGINEAFGALTGTLKSMQSQIKADTLLKIAAAVGLLTLSIIALSMIDSKKLAKALAAVSVSFGILQIALASLAQAVGLFGTLKIPILTASLVLLAGALALMTISVKVLSTLSWEELAKGLGAVVVLLAALSLAAIPLSANSAGMVRAGAGLILLAIALKIMASAVKDFAAMQWSEMAKGFAGFTTALLIIIGAMKLMPRGIVAQAAALAILGVALNIIAAAVTRFANLSVNEIAKGLLALSGALALIVSAMRLMPKNMVATASGLLIVSVALNAIAFAVDKMGGMSWEEIGKGMVVMAGSLAILAVALKFMAGTVLGAVALTIAAGALTLMVPVLLALGAMSWEAIAKGLISLAGAFTVLGVAGYLLGPLTPVILGLSLAVLAIGAGFALAGAGALAFATAFGMVVAAGTAGIAVLSGMLGVIIQAIPRMMRAFGAGIVAFVVTIGKGAQQLAKAFGRILSAMLDAIIKNAPKIGKAFLTLLNTLLNIVVKSIPKIVEAGFRLIMSFLGALDRHIPKIVQRGASIVVKFINGVANNIDRIIQAGVNLILKFIQGLTKAINNNSKRLGRAGGELAWAIIRGMANGLWEGSKYVADAAWDVAKNALKRAMEALGINSPSKEFEALGKYSDQGFANGLSTYSRIVDKSAVGVAKSALSSMKATMSNIQLDNINVNPTISPVLDLTQLKKDAGKMDGILGSNPIKAGVSFNQAASISESQAASNNADNGPSEPVVQEIKFEQNNYSPKAISPQETYRNTRSQISLAKEALSK